MDIGDIWRLGVTQPMINGLVLLYVVLGSNFGLAIIAFTIISRVLMYPLTMRQLRQTSAMQKLAPQMKSMQEKYKNDRQRLQREQMRLYREAGVNPLGCLGPMIIQMPIFFGLFIAIRAALADTPEGLVSLSSKLYSWLPGGDAAIPLNARFLGLDLGSTPSDSSFPILLPVLVGGSMWVVQKMVMARNADPSQAGVASMMTWMMPLMFGFFTLSFPNGLAIYWVATNVVSIALQYRVTGWGGLARKPAPAPAGGSSEGTAPQPALQARGAAQGGLLRRIFLGSPPAPATDPPPPELEPEVEEAAPPAATPAATPTATVDKGDAGGISRSDGQDRRRSDRKSFSATRRRPRRRRGRGRR